MASTTTADISPLPFFPRPNETIGTLRARLVYQSRKQGTLGSDLLLNTLAQDNLDITMTQEELNEYGKARVCQKNGYWIAVNCTYKKLTSTYIF